MIILTIRTDNPDAELGLYDGDRQLTYKPWPAHRMLAETIHTNIAELLREQRLNLQQLEGIVVFNGPGSFTGLRIGISVANSFADGLCIPIVGSSGQRWQDEAIQRLQRKENDNTVCPEYGAEPRTTMQTK